MTSQNSIVLDDEALERPLYTGIPQWTAMKQTASKGSHLSTRTPSVPSTSSASKQDASTNHQHRKASAYLHLPVTNPPRALALWEVPPQQVCKPGATPTAVCGRYSTSLQNPPMQPKRGRQGPYKCPRCCTGYSRVDTVRAHFPSCIALNGNPDCLSWTDHDTYAAGVAERNASRAEEGVVRKARKLPITKAAQLVTLGVSEVVIRFSAYYNRNSNGELPPATNTKEEEEEAWKAIVKNLKEETRYAREISPETEALIETFKEDGLWDSESSDEA